MKTLSEKITSVRMPGLPNGFILTEDVKEFIKEYDLVIGEYALKMITEKEMWDKLRKLTGKNLI